ncbi:hypothetical protein TNCT_167221 [Trichonephila clavata]|uniref:Uncharacterized protein n=1 Tax=Trichonephila clavata TaxID=2740835 RepID=A0A8X6F6E3_TRICU|nr:hypothetical protein TNCT_167221 [Trichonephila clavata]
MIRTGDKKRRNFSDKTEIVNRAFCQHAKPKQNVLFLFLNKRTDDSKLSLGTQRVSWAYLERIETQMHCTVKMFFFYTVLRCYVRPFANGIQAMM